MRPLSNRSRRLKSASFWAPCSPCSPSSIIWNGCSETRKSRPIRRMLGGSLSIVQACTKFYRGTNRSWMAPDEDYELFLVTHLRDGDVRTMRDELKPHRRAEVRTFCAHCILIERF